MQFSYFFLFLSLSLDPSFLSRGRDEKHGESFLSFFSSSFYHFPISRAMHFLLGAEDSAKVDTEGLWEEVCSAGGGVCLLYSSSYSAAFLWDIGRLLVGAIASVFAAGSSPPWCTSHNSSTFICLYWPEKPPRKEGAGGEVN